MKGYNSDFDIGGVGGGGSDFDVGGVGSDCPVNGQDYNTASSSSVRKVDNVVITANSHSMPVSSSPNTVIKNFNSGKLNTERYFNSEGKPYLDIDYTNHGNSKTHPVVPHQHDIKADNDGGFYRGREERIKK